MSENGNITVEDFDNRPTVTMSRREIISGLATGTVVAFSGAALSGCVTNSALGRKQFLLVSDAELEQLSAASWNQLLTQNRQTNDPALRRQVAAVGDRIVRGADQRLPDFGLTQRNWEFAVFDDPTVNAWVMPGGKVGFHTGLLDVTQNDDQIATVMGHEVGHVVGRHAAERYSQQMAASSGLALANVALADNENRGLIAGILGAGVTFGVILPYSRKHEYEADRLGADFMVDANYRANEAVRFWDGMTQRSSQKPMEFMSTHPSDQSRIATMQSYITSQGYV
ncbi:M48 family metallopeptidase [Alterisphingorhabdus coralli]|uniref:M48 family metallopeptidase n=1 Tax=Alterisphingorhabdus coralli TaxID=3071408 RepID=A0AA97F9I2_9SPHN|nr:M48 family metallopeptidase [Parasphingorhabdus sp. SCSIO 66989]WOE76396.1 M48 family metallopeptidase [Parasphingorhabdus sp. SCSIO 66989]